MNGEDKYVDEVLARITKSSRVRELDEIMSRDRTELCVFASKTWLDGAMEARRLIAQLEAEPKEWNPFKRYQQVREINIARRAVRIFEQRAARFLGAISVTTMKIA